MTDSAFYDQIFRPFESQWNDATDQAPRPFYILSPFFLQSQQMLTTLKSRMAGINAAASTDRTLVNTYVNLYKSEFPGEISYTDLENFYDAPYFLMYAAAAAVRNAPQQLRGRDLADGMKQLIDMDGPRYGIGVDKSTRILQALTNGSIRLDGAMGPPEFNPNTGSRETPGSVWCVNGSNAPVSDVLRYNAGELELGVDRTNGKPLEELPCAAEF
jgi:hypothetical protein